MKIQPGRLLISPTWNPYWCSLLRLQPIKDEPHPLQANHFSRHFIKTKAQLPHSVVQRNFESTCWNPVVTNCFKFAVHLRALQIQVPPLSVSAFRSWLCYNSSQLAYPALLMLTTVSCTHSSHPPSIRTLAAPPICLQPGWRQAYTVRYFQYLYTAATQTIKRNRV